MDAPVDSHLLWQNESSIYEHQNQPGVQKASPLFVQLRTANGRGQGVRLQILDSNQQFLVDLHLRRIQLLASLDSQDLSIWWTGSALQPSKSSNSQATSPTNQANGTWPSRAVKNPLKLWFSDGTEIDHLLLEIFQSLSLNYPRLPIQIVSETAACQQLIESVTQNALEKISVDSSVEPSSPSSDIQGSLMSPESQFSIAILPKTRQVVSKLVMPSASTSSNYIKSYIDMCDFFGREPNDIIIWQAKNVWNANRRFTVPTHLLDEQLDLLPVVAALEHCMDYSSLYLKDCKPIGELLNVIQMILVRNLNIQCLGLHQVSIGKDVAQIFLRMFETKNLKENLFIRSLDFEEVSMDSKYVGQWTERLASINSIEHLRFKECTLGKRGIASVVTMIKMGLSLSSSTNTMTGSGSQVLSPLSPPSSRLMENLLSIDLSKNIMQSETFGILCDFLAQPNELRALVIAGCGVNNVELLFRSAVRGCVIHLRHLNIEGNRFSLSSEHSSGSSVPSYVRQFFQTSQSLTYFNGSSTKMQSIYLQEMLIGLQENYNTSDFTLVMKGCDFTAKEALLFKENFPVLLGLTGLDLSDNLFENDLGLMYLVDAICDIPKLSELKLDKVFSRLSQTSASRSRLSRGMKEDGGKSPVDLQSLIKKLMSLSNLKSLSLADNLLQMSLNDTFRSLSGKPEAALSLFSLDIHGNNMRDHGAFQIAELMASNQNLRYLNCVKNDFTVEGWQIIFQTKKTMQSNLYIEFPPAEIEFIMENSPKCADFLDLLLSQERFSVVSTPHCAYGPNEILSLQIDSFENLIKQVGKMAQSVRSHFEKSKQVQDYMRKVNDFLQTVKPVSSLALDLRNISDDWIQSYTNMLMANIGIFFERTEKSSDQALSDALSVLMKRIVGVFSGTNRSQDSRLGIESIQANLAKIANMIYSRKGLPSKILPISTKEREGILDLLVGDLCDSLMKHGMILLEEGRELFYRINNPAYQPESPVVAPADPINENNDFEDLDKLTQKSKPLTHLSKGRVAPKKKKKTDDSIDPELNTPSSRETQERSLSPPKKLPQKPLSDIDSEHGNGNRGIASVTSSNPSLSKEKPLPNNTHTLSVKTIQLKTNADSNSSKDLNVSAQTTDLKGAELVRKKTLDKVSGGVRNNSKADGTRSPVLAKVASELSTPTPPKRKESVLDSSLSSPVSPSSITSPVMTSVQDREQLKTSLNSLLQPSTKTKIRDSEDHVPNENVKDEITETLGANDCVEATKESPEMAVPAANLTELQNEETDSFDLEKATQKKKKTGLMTKLGGMLNMSRKKSESIETTVDVAPASHVPVTACNVDDTLSAQNSMENLDALSAQNTQISEHMSASEIDQNHTSSSQRTDVSDQKKAPPPVAPRVTRPSVPPRPTLSQSQTGSQSDVQSDHNGDDLQNNDTTSLNSREIVSSADNLSESQKEISSKPLGVKYGVRLPMAELALKAASVSQSQGSDDNSLDRVNKIEAKLASNRTLQRSADRITATTSQETLSRAASSEMLAADGPPPIISAKPIKSRSTEAITEHADTSEPRKQVPLANPDPHTTASTNNKPVQPSRKPSTTNITQVPLNKSITNVHEKQIDEDEIHRWIQHHCQHLKLSLDQPELPLILQDGRSILELTEALTSIHLTQTPFPKYKKAANLLIGLKIDNLNVFLQFCRDKLDLGIAVQSITAEDLMNADKKRVMILMTALYKRFPISSTPENKL